MRLVVFGLITLGCSAPAPWPNQVAEVGGSALAQPLQPQSSFAIDPSFSDSAHDEILTACAELNVAFPVLQLYCGDSGSWRFEAASLPDNVGGKAFNEGNVIAIDEAKIRAYREDPRWLRHAAMHEVIHELGYSWHSENEKSLMYYELRPVFCIDQETVDVVSSLRPELAEGAQTTCL